MAIETRRGNSWCPDALALEAAVWLAGVVMTSRRLIGCLLLAVMAFAAQAGAQAPSSAPVTFARDVASIFVDRCGMCHHPNGSAPFSLLDYPTARQHATQIAAVTKSRLGGGALQPGHGAGGGGAARRVNRSISSRASDHTRLRECPQQFGQPPRARGEYRGSVSEFSRGGAPRPRKRRGPIQRRQPGVRPRRPARSARTISKGCSAQPRVGHSRGRPCVAARDVSALRAIDGRLRTRARIQRFGRADSASPSCWPIA